MLACAGRRESEDEGEPAQSVDRKMGLDRNNRREGNALLASSFFVDAAGEERRFFCHLDYVAHTFSAKERIRTATALDRRRETCSADM